MMKQIILGALALQNPFAGHLCAAGCYLCCYCVAIEHVQQTLDKLQGSQGVLTVATENFEVWMSDSDQSRRFTSYFEQVTYVIFRLFKHDSN